ncbi:sulfotransferase family protein [Microbulbifer hydrolyticus]|uniref:Sulfotransferase family protein n=1 Tax=Microbulbifer hydrolyticus TaxID=48074 RepID=A0ABX6IYX2_9GAMM|nr:hypothetical protein [Microbulbifer hydrolyticus]QHQ38931.1 hypothetical protein GTQ55_08015 [Microbulbifer hydrolyticus]
MTQTAAEYLPLKSDKVEKQTQQRTAIVVLGMHRSGTSAWTRCLSLLGAELPQHVFGVGAGNETGHWEAERLVDLNNRLLEACGSRWDDWRAIDFSLLSPPVYEQYLSEIKETILEEYEGAKLLLLKDPRICRLADIYSEALKSLDIEVRFLIPYRDPLSVVESLGRRDKMAEQFAAALWLRHVLDALRLTEGMTRVIVSYERLLSDWRQSIGVVGNQLGVNLRVADISKERELENFLSPTLRHHNSSISKLVHPPKLMQWSAEVYSALSQCEGGFSVSCADNVLSSVRKQFDEVSGVMGGAVFPELSARESKYSQQIQDQINCNIGLREQLLGRESDIESLLDEKVTVERELSDYRSRLETIAKDNESLRDRLLILEGSKFNRLTRKVKSVVRSAMGKAYQR